MDTRKFGIILISISVIIFFVFLIKNVIEFKKTSEDIAIRTAVLEESLFISKTKSKIIQVGIFDDPNANTKEYINGNKIIGKIKITKIGLDDVILEKTTDKSLKSGICKYKGPSLNDLGNVSIVAHNYKIQRSNLFTELDKLGKEDTFSITDSLGKCIYYKVYDKFVVDPDNLSVTDTTNNYKREVTLITCTKLLDKRIIIKAAEI